MKQKFYTVGIWIEDECNYSRMGWDESGDGDLSYCPTKPALFTDRNEARKAIEISKAKARLLKAQGKIFNSDFIPPMSRNIKIIQMDYRGAK